LGPSSGSGGKRKSALFKQAISWPKASPLSEQGH
jgi:hypothetical protein